jgi:hypothetical protein
MEAKRLGDLQKVENKKKHRAANSKYNFIRVELENGAEIPLLFTDNEIKKAQERAAKNPEDLPKISKLKDLFD